MLAKEKAMLDSMTEPTPVDTNDAIDNPDEAFERLADLEGHFYKRGAIAGALGHAVEEGQEDGYHLGWTAGAEVSKEWNFYRGFAETLKRELIDNPAGGGARADVPGWAKDKTHKEKVRKAITRLIECCNEVSVEKVGNDPKVDFEKRSQEMRRLFRKVTLLLGMQHVTYDAGKQSRTANISF